jgi:hypothetical protein
MEGSAIVPRRDGAVAVSLHRRLCSSRSRYAAFYADFGLDVRRQGDARFTHWHEHAGAPRRPDQTPEYVSFGAYADDA